MRTLAKLLLGIVASLAAIVAVLVVGLLLIDWNILRSTVSEQASSASGRQVEIGGDLDVHLWSWTPEVIAQDVVVSNPEWASRPEMVRIAELYARFRVLPLLKGRLEVEQLRLTEPLLALERQDDRANWESGAESTSTAAVQAAAPNEREDFPVLIDATVENGVLLFQSPDLEEPLEVALQAVRLHAGGPEEPVSLEIEGSYQDRAFSLTGRGGSFLQFRNPDEAYRVNLEAAIGGTRLSAEGGVQEPLALQAVDTQFELAGDTLAELYEIFGLPLPDSPPYALSGRLTREGDRWALHDVDGRLGESDLHGNVEVATGGERPRIVAEVSSQSFRSEDFEGFWGEDPEEEKPESDRILSDEPFSLPKLRRMDAEVRFTGESVVSGPLQLENLSTELTLEDGLLRLQPLELGLAEGRITADLQLDGRGDLPEMAGNISVEGLDLNALLAFFDLENAAAGQLRGQLELTMQGRSMHELGASADGGGALIMSGGEIRNIVLEAIALDLQEALAQWFTDDQTMVEILCLAMPTQIRAGRFEAQPWILDTTDALVSITGSVDLGSETVDVVLEPHPKDFSLFNYLTSIEITGDLSERETQVDPLEAAGKLALKTLATPLMPFLSGEIQESAQEQSVPCDYLRRQFEGALAEGEPAAEAAAEASPGAEPGAEPDDSEPDGPGPEADPESGSAGAAPRIEEIQGALNRRGHTLTVDGIMGPQTREALRAFQQQAGLPATGEADDATLQQLGVTTPPE